MRVRKCECAPDRGVGVQKLRGLEVEGFRGLGVWRLRGSEAEVEGLRG